MSSVEELKEDLSSPKSPVKQDQPDSQGDVAIDNGNGSDEGQQQQHQQQNAAETESADSINDALTKQAGEGEENSNTTPSAEAEGLTETDADNVTDADLPAQAKVEEETAQQSVDTEQAQSSSSPNNQTQQQGPSKPRARNVADGGGRPNQSISPRTTRVPAKPVAGKVHQTNTTKQQQHASVKDKHATPTALRKGAYSQSASAQPKSNSGTAAGAKSKQIRSTGASEGRPSHATANAVAARHTPRTKHTLRTNPRNPDPKNRNKTSTVVPSCDATVDKTHAESQIQDQGVEDAGVKGTPSGQAVQDTEIKQGNDDGARKESGGGEGGVQVKQDGAAVVEKSEHDDDDGVDHDKKLHDKVESAGGNDAPSEANVESSTTADDNIVKDTAGVNEIGGISPADGGGTHITAENDTAGTQDTGIQEEEPRKTQHQGSVHGSGASSLKPVAWQSSVILMQRQEKKLTELNMRKLRMRLQTFQVR
jgi:hypothetical protein